MEDIALIQSVIFKVFGFIPFSLLFGCFEPLKKLINGLFRIFALCFLITCAGGWTFVASSSIYGGLSGDGKRPFIVALVDILFDCFYTARAIIIMTIFYSNRGTWVLLYSNANQLLDRFLSDKTTLQTLRRLSGLLFTVTFLCHALWVSLQWTNSEALIQIGLNSTASDYQFFDFSITAKQYVSFWSLIDILFVLSQQVIMSSVILAVMLVKVLELLEAEIQAEIHNHIDRSNHRVLSDFWPDFGRKIRFWPCAYTESCKLLQQFNDFFSMILFTSVGLDVMSALAFSMSILTTDIKGPYPKSYLAYQIFNVGLFLSYTTIFLSPFIVLYEKASKFALLNILCTVCCHISPVTWLDF